MMKHAWLPALILLGIVGCHSDAYYQEQAVESAREFIFKHARELTPEQYSVVKFNPPVILNGNIFEPASESKAKDAVFGEELRQICIAWRIPGAENDYLVYGYSEPRMAYWKPLRLIRRRLTPAPKGPAKALSSARKYAVTALDGQLSFADLNTVRFTHPSLLLTSFPLQDPQGKEESAEESESENGKKAAELPLTGGARKFSPREGFVSGGIPPVDSPVRVGTPRRRGAVEVPPPFPRPWQRITVPQEGKKDILQLSLVWKISGNRHVVFCGLGEEDLSAWTLCLAGVVGKTELAENTVRELKTPEQFLFRIRDDEKEEDPEKIFVVVQPRSEAPPAPVGEENSDDDNEISSDRKKGGKPSKKDRSEEDHEPENKGGTEMRNGTDEDGPEEEGGAGLKNRTDGGSGSLFGKGV